MRWFGRLRRSSEIAFVRRRGRVIPFPNFAMYASEASTGPVRVGVTVSKAVGGAVIRNRVRRRIRGALDELSPGPDRMRLLFVAKPAAALASYDELARDVAAAIERSASGRGPESGIDREIVGRRPSGAPSIVDVAPGTARA